MTEDELVLRPPKHVDLVGCSPELAPDTFGQLRSFHRALRH